ncbi:acyl-CoA-binding domain-containing protein 6 isoform 2 [Camelus ferus]|nr:acyl-CoA-binding domain-containing protein 6 isoform 2 [Camelus ferus]
MASPFLPSGATTGDSGGELSSGDDSGDMESLQSPETEAVRSLTELFEKAAAHLQGLVQVASREQLLYLYARYKQVKVGNCNTPKPSFFDFEGKQKCFLESDCKGCCLKFAFPMGHYFSFLEGSLEEGQEDGKGEEQVKREKLRTIGKLSYRRKDFGASALELKV